MARSRKLRRGRAWGAIDKKYLGPKVFSLKPPNRRSFWSRSKVCFLFDIFHQKKFRNVFFVLVGYKTIFVDPQDLPTNPFFASLRILKLLLVPLRLICSQLKLSFFYFLIAFILQSQLSAMQSHTIVKLFQQLFSVCQFLSHSLLLCARNMRIKKQKIIPMVMIPDFY